MTRPCLLIAGSNDDLNERVRRCAHKLPNATCVELEGLNHVHTGLELARIIPSLVSFMSRHG